MKESFEKVRRELLARVNRLCESNLNSKNLFKAINEHAISLVNYHIGLQHLEPADFLKLDHEIHQALIKHKVHLKPGCKERLYLPRTEMGRGLHSVEMKSEYMLLQLLDTLKNIKIFHQGEQRSCKSKSKIRLTSLLYTNTSGQSIH
ncbi:hypothetical protein TCON_2633 [Astathelohania contejeani]|uniref:Uncharacterized protein n=1 Tax=Astathelohania contejeani TaxID=164912 RepID=A0ABQ7HVG5_9MICR|nr:hypothetical protein TCON_2633 [Thelohania contejeani]